MIKQINEEQRQLKEVYASAVQVCSALSEDTVLTESFINLQQTIKKVLVTNKEIPTALALVIAKIIVFSDLIDGMIENKKRYKKYPTLKKVYDRITDKVSADLSVAANEQIDNVNVDMVSIAKDITAQLVGKVDLVTDVQTTFELIFDRLNTNTTERNRVRVMKLTSLIVQSNRDTNLRKQFIKQYL